MAIRQRINFFRKRKRLTQKQLRKILGFKKKNPNMRIKKYKSKVSVPKLKRKQSFVEVYYLIDFENVHEDGLTGSEKLDSHDHVHIFSTKNASKISIGKLTDFNSVDLSSHEIPPGKQSLDMHLVSYLGYLIGTTNNDECEYVIISKDTDYDNIISFWKNHNILNIKRKDAINAEGTNVIVQENISKNNDNTSKSNIAADKSVVSDTTTADNYANQRKKVKINTRIKTQLNSTVQKTISKAGYDNKTTNKVASIVVKFYGKDKFASNVHSELGKHYSNSYDLYEIVKPIINQYSSSNTTANKTNTASHPNNEIQTTLSQAGYKKDVVSSVDSIITKHKKEKNYKHTIYLDIIKQYGQEKGLKIYNNIKKKI